MDLLEEVVRVLLRRLAFLFNLGVESERTSTDLLGLVVLVDCGFLLAGFFETHSQFRSRPLTLLRFPYEIVLRSLPTFFLVVFSLQQTRATWSRLASVAYAPLSVFSILHSSFALCHRL